MSKYIETILMNEDDDYSNLEKDKEYRFIRMAGEEATLVLRGTPYYKNDKTPWQTPWQIGRKEGGPNLRFWVKSKYVTKEAFVEFLRIHHPDDFEWLVIWHPEIFDGKYFVEQK